MTDENIPTLTIEKFYEYNCSGNRTITVINTILYINFI